MRSLLASVLLALCATLAQGQNFRWRIATVANLPATCEPGRSYIVSDGASLSDCATGSGSTQTICTCNSSGDGYTSFFASVATGPGSSTDEAIARFDGAGGATLQNSSVTIDDSGNYDSNASNGPQIRAEAASNTNPTLIPDRGNNGTGIGGSGGGGTVALIGLSDEIAVFDSVGATAINYFEFDNSTTGNPVTISAQGDDTNVGIDITGQGTGRVSILSGLDVANAGEFHLLEAVGNGTNYLAFVAPSAVTSNQTCTFENDSSFIPDSCVGDGTDDVNTIPPHCILIADPVTDAEWYTIWYASYAVTLTSISSEVTGGTSVAFDLEIDDGTPTGVNGSNITATTTFATDASLAGDTTMSAGDRLDIDFGTVTGSVTQLSVCFTYTED